MTEGGMDHHQDRHPKCDMDGCQIEAVIEFVAERPGTLRIGAKLCDDCAMGHFSCGGIDG